MSSRRRQARLKVLGNVALAVLAVATVGAVASVAMTPGSPPPVSDKVQAAYDEGSTLAPPVSPGVPKPMAAFIGDSYAQGAGSSVQVKRWTALVADQLGWAENNKGRGGTGYVATSDVNGCGMDYCPNYPEMIDIVVADKPSIVVVSGGQNDFSTFNDDPAKVTEAIALTFRTLREKLPEATLVAVGPSSPWGVGGPVTGLDQAVQDAASSVKAKYVSLIDPDVIDKTMLLPDGAHIGDTGHAAIAERVIAALR